MRFRLALAVTTLLAAGALGGSDATEHGNNPHYEWSGVNVGGIELAVPFDVWVIMEILAPDVMGPAADCLETALAGCGEGRICCYCLKVDNGDGSCFFSCQDGSGNCQPCPECDNKHHWNWLPPEDQR